MNFTQQLVATQQERLADLQYYLGKIDGYAGPATEFSFTDFKANNGLLKRSYPGPITMQTLWTGKPVSRPVAPPHKGEPPNLAEARRLLGVSEVAGPGNNPIIMKWAKDLEQWYPGDDVPWCGLFAAHVNKVGYPDEPQDFNRLGAREWLKYGVEEQNKIPSLGATCVLWRTHRTQSWNGHVFIVTGQNPEAIRGIGGNQSDQVREDWFPRSRVLGFRVPTNFGSNPAPLAKTGVFSINEA